jgi:sugar transferase (PEP-CTERM/EpsH1 system associated)
VNILFIVPYTPNLIRVRPYNLIRSLAARGHHVKLATLWSSEAEREAAEKLREFCDSVIAAPLHAWRSLFNCLMALPSREPLQAAYCWQPELAKTITQLVDAARDGNAIDIVHVEHLRGVRFGLSLIKREQRRQGSTKPLPPIVWDSVDNISHLFRQATKGSKRAGFRWLSQLELRRTEKFEGWLVSQFRPSLVTSEKDKNAFLALNPGGKADPWIEVLPNGVDLEYFTPGSYAERETNAIVVSGKMSYHANVSMVTHLIQEIMPRVWERRPDARLWVVGKDPTREVYALARDERILVTGTVDDIRPYLQKATLAVAPLTYGAGIQNKVLESMACATPVVATPLAISALSAVEGQDILAAEAPQDFAEKVLRLLESDPMRYSIGQSGRRYVENTHDWGGIAEKLESLYDESIATRI